jgi:hypothetical protein
VHVNRTIQTLRSLNVLSKTSQLEVIDRKQLAQVAKFDGRYLDMPKLLSNWAVRVETTSRTRRTPKLLFRWPVGR